ncbi:putative arabinose-proton symporter [Triangularia setosa]|uniref:Arabinose-proton symporter n=1 Tax=Triangularia setosa TaxID=2587417 RepID=A0AAN6W5H2_9PEZI|nr:putative arabinose-proton symporter [Podospora setosa]
MPDSPTLSDTGTAGNEKLSSEPKGAIGHHLEKGQSVGEHVDLNENLEARIRNPLEGIPRDQLMQRVEAFCEEKGLIQHIELFRKGALVAQNPDDYDRITGAQALDETERKVLRDEVQHKWRLPAKLFLTIATCSIGAAVQGWDQTGTNGANIFFPAIYGIGGPSTRDKLLLGLVNAGPYIGSAFCGCWLSDPINNLWGRRGVIFFSAHFCLWPVIGSAFCHTWWEQLICRLFMGVGMGVKASTVPIYAAENSPASIRGALVMSWQMWTAFGIMLGTAFNLAVWNTGDINWRLMLGAPFIPAVPLLVLIYFCPESPRWYMKKNRYGKAWDAMIRLRNHPIQVARDIFYIHSQLELEEQLLRNSSYLQRMAELFTIPRVRRATLAAFTVMIAQQMCGINIIAFYSTTIFKEAGQDDFQALLASFGFGLVNWLFAFPAFWTIDTFGRRSLLLFTFPQMTWTLLAAGLCTLLEQGTARTALVALFVYLFAAFYSPGEGPVPFTYSAEVFPLSHREVGMGFSVATCLFWAAVLGMTFPFLLDTTGTVGAFGCYAGFNAVAMIMIFFWVPETKQKTLEELDYVFAVPTKKFAGYQVKHVFPWWFKRWVLWRRDAKLKPLYTMDHEHHQVQKPREGSGSHTLSETQVEVGKSAGVGGAVNGL